MIAAENLTKDYGTTQALRGVSFDIPANEVVGLLGPNGAGKTTLMKLLTGYLHPSGGSAKIDQIDVVADPLTVQAMIGYLPENAPLYHDMLVQEYLAMMAALREIPGEKHGQLIADAVRRTGLEDHTVRPIGELSKGYRQRVGLAQAILHNPRVLILDEPTSGLDPSQIVEIRQLIKDLAKNATVLLSTHILPEVEITCERVLIINEGSVRTDARLETLQASNAALVSIDNDSAVVRQTLQSLPGVTMVTQLDTPPSNGYFSYRVVGDNRNLCPAIFDLVRDRGWRLSELRPDQQTLEAVFRNVTEGKEAPQ